MDVLRPVVRPEVWTARDRQVNPPCRTRARISLLEDRCRLPKRRRLRAGFPLGGRRSGQVAIGHYIYFSLSVGYAKFCGMIGESQKPEPIQPVIDVLEAGSVSQIINSKRAITPEMALRLSRVTSTTPEFWLDLQRRSPPQARRRAQAHARAARTKERGRALHRGLSAASSLPCRRPARRRHRGVTDARDFSGRRCGVILTVATAACFLGRIHFSQA